MKSKNRKEIRRQRRRKEKNEKEKLKNRKRKKMSATFAAVRTTSTGARLPKIPQAIPRIKQRMGKKGARLDPHEMMIRKKE